LTLRRHSRAGGTRFRVRKQPHELEHLTSRHANRILIEGDPLYVPKSWTGDRERCEEAGIGQDVAFATKPELAKTMIGRVRKRWRRR
jgi:hypothetical protein